MGKPLFPIDAASMQVEVTSYKIGWNMVWTTMFPLKYSRTFDLKGITGNDGLPVAADKVAFNAKLPQKGRKKLGSWSGELHKIGVKRIKDEKEVNEYLDSEIVAQRTEDPALARDLIDEVYNDLKFVADGMDARMEIDGCQIASSGVALINDETDGDEHTADILDFNIPANQFLGAKAPWSTKDEQGNIVPNTKADGIGDIIAAQKVVKEQGKAKPMFVYITQTAFELLQAQETTARRLFPEVKSLSVISAEMLTLASINAYLARNQYPQLLVIDPMVNVEDKLGNVKPVKPFNENVLTFSLTPQLGYTYWKTVPKSKDAATVEAYGAYYKTSVSGNVEPLEETTRAEAYVQQGLINRHSMVLLNCNNTEWANGARPE